MESYKITLRKRGETRYSEIILRAPSVDHAVADAIQEFKSDRPKLQSHDVDIISKGVWNGKAE